MLRKLISARRLAVVVAMAAAMPVMAVPAPASADPIGEIVNSIGPRRCSLTASATVETSTRQIRGSGSLTCNTVYFEISLVVCIETSQTGAEGTWTEAGCAPPAVRNNASSIPTQTASITCPPQAAYYRVRSSGEAVHSNGDLQFLGTLVGQIDNHGCPLA